MSVKAIHEPSGGDALRVVGGFEDGSVLLWDSRKPSVEVSALKLFPEPGECTTVYSARLVQHVLNCNGI